ncbi:MAG: hypothetical protein AB7L66_00620 [Gemmatimonadales bacterium]
MTRRLLAGGGSLLALLLLGSTPAHSRRMAESGSAFGPARREAPHSVPTSATRETAASPRAEHPDLPGGALPADPAAPALRSPAVSRSQAGAAGPFRPAVRRPGYFPTGPPRSS